MKAMQEKLSKAKAEIPNGDGLVTSAATAQLPLEVKYVLRKEIRRDENQPRKVFDEEKLKELRDSILAVGIRQPLQVTLQAGEKEGIKADGVRYLLVDGERRWRAAELAGVERVPVMVVDTSAPEWEKQKLAIQMVLNQQHENLTALEEAAAYKKEIDEGRHTAESLYKAQGVSRAHLFGRLALNRLPKFAVDALMAGRISTSVAGLIPMIPGEEKQKEFIEQVEEDGYGGAAMSFRDAQEKLEEEFCQQLKGAPFDQADGELMPAEWVGEGLKFTGQPAVSLTAGLRAHVATRVEDNGQGKKKTVCGVWSGERSSTILGIGGGDGSKLIADGLTEKHASFLVTLINRGNAGLLRRVKGGACTDCPFRSGNLAEYPDAAKRPNVCTQPSCYHQKVKAHWVQKAGKAVKNGETVLDLTTYKRTKGQYVEADKEGYFNQKYTTAAKALGKKAPPAILATTATGLIKVYKKEEAKKAGLKLQEPYRSSYDLTPEEREKKKAKEEKAKAVAASRSKLVRDHAAQVGAGIAKLNDKEAWTLVMSHVERGYASEFRKEMQGAVKTERDKFLCALLSGHGDSPVDWQGAWNATIVKRWKEIGGVDLVKLEAASVAATAKAEKEKEKPPGGGAKAEARTTGGHQWKKTDLVSGVNSNYKCEVCGVKAVRYGIGWPPRIKGKRDLKKFGTCPGKGGKGV